MIFLGKKLSGHEANSLPSTSEVKNGGATPPFHCMFSWHGAYLFKNRDNFIIIIVVTITDIQFQRKPLLI
jgi:hypothetical protein